MSKSILILGGTGAIGTPLVELVAEQGYEVYVTSRSQRYSDKQNIHYIQGNAQDSLFLKTALNIHYNAIFDFMIYYIPEAAFEERIDLLLSAADQYFFLSSATVYAESKELITEKTARYVDIYGMEAAMFNRPYIAYKSWQEDILKRKETKNWTIIRPYITYAEERMQLGNFEKEIWLYRALKNKTIIFPEEVAEHITTLTYGKDVARAMVSLIGNERAYGDIYHITTSQHIKWAEVLEIYLNVIEEVKGFRPKVKIPEKNVLHSTPDRLVDRVFDNSKIMEIVGTDFTDVEKGLENCLRSFIDDDRLFRDIPWRVHGRHDAIAGELMDIEEIPSETGRKEYMLGRFGDYLDSEGVSEEKGVCEKWLAFSNEVASKDWNKVKRILDEYGAKRVGIYALSNYAKQLVSIFETAADSQIEYFLYDGDCKKWGIQIGNTHVSSPDKAYCDKLDVLWITNKRYFDSIYEYYKELHASGVSILGVDTIEQVMLE